MKQESYESEGHGYGEDDEGEHEFCRFGWWKDEEERGSVCAFKSGRKWEEVLDVLCVKGWVDQGLLKNS